MEWYILICAGLGGLFAMSHDEGGAKILLGAAGGAVLGSLVVAMVHIATT